LAVAFLQRPEVQQNLPNSLTNQQFVQKLESIAGVTLANESTLIANLNNSSQTRAQVLRTVAESAEVVDKFYKPNFVMMEYFGYLHRDPEDCHDDHNWVGGDPYACGYFFHNSRFNLSSNADLVENVIVRGFIESPEYRHRFGP
jgi:patatin-like phospholipase/acyl hydrolase